MAHSKVALDRVTCSAAVQWTAGAYSDRQECAEYLIYMELFLCLFACAGDAYFLHAQERVYGGYILAQKEGVPSYFLPTASDRFVVAYRQWLKKYAGEWNTGLCGHCVRNTIQYS